MNRTEVADMVALADAATPGPWWPRYGGEPGYVFSSGAMTLVATIAHESSDASPRPDSLFIAAARTAVPELAASMLRVEALVERLRAKTARNFGRMTVCSAADIREALDGTELKS